MWKTVKLGDVCDLQSGFAFKSTDYIERSNTLNIRMSNIRPNGTFDPLHNVRYLPDSYAKIYDRYKLFDGDLIIAMTDMAGDPKILGKPTIIHDLKGKTFLLNQRVGKLHDFSEKIFVPYLCYFLSTLKDFYKSKGAGGLQINISKKDILSASIKIPSIAEQHRIVAKLDAAFAEIDKAAALAETKEAEINSLKSAFLTSSLNNDSAIKTVKLGEVCDFVRGPFGGSLKKSIFVNEGYAVYEQQHPINNQCSDFRYFITSQKFSEMSRFQVKTGDILMSCSGTIGKTTIIPPESPSGIINQALLKISPHKNINVHYLQLFMGSKKFSEQLMDTVDGAAIQNVASVKVLKEIKVLLPPLAEQKRIVTKLDAAFAKLDTAKASIIKSKNNYKALKSSILKQELQTEATS